MSSKVKLEIILLQPVEACLGGGEPRRRDEVEAAAVIQIAGTTRTA